MSSEYLSQAAKVGGDLPDIKIGPYVEPTGIVANFRLGQALSR